MIISEEWFRATTVQRRGKVALRGGLGEFTHRSGSAAAAAARGMHPRIRGEGEAGRGEQQTYGGGGGGGADEREEDDGGGEGAGAPLLPRRPRSPRARLVLAVAAAGHGSAAARTGLGIWSCRDAGETTDGACVPERVKGLSLQVGPEKQILGPVGIDGPKLCVFLRRMGPGCVR